MNAVYWLSHRVFRELSRGFFNLETQGIENVAAAGPALLASNHVSFLDPPFIGASLEEDIIFFARRSLFRYRISNYLLTNWQTIPVDRDKPEPGSIKTVLRRLKDSKKVLIFPEGTRSTDGKLQVSEPGVGMLIAKAQVPIIPVRMFGAFEAMPKDSKLPRPSTITIVYGKPWHCDLTNYHQQGKALYQTLADEVMRRIGELRVV